MLVFAVEKGPPVTHKIQLEIGRTLVWVFYRDKAIIIGSKMDSFFQGKTLLFIVIHFSL